MRQRQQLSCFAVFRSEPDHFAVAGRSFFGALQTLEENAQVGVRINMVRVQSDGCAIRAFRFDRLPGRPQQHSQIAMGIRVARIDGDRTPVRIDCEVQPVVRLEDDAEVAVPVRLIGHERETPLDEREGFVGPPLFMREHTGVVQRTRMIGGLSNSRSAILPQVTIYGLSPILEVKGPGRLVVERLDKQGERHEVMVGKNSLLRGRFYDFVSAFLALTLDRGRYRV